MKCYICDKNESTTRITIGISFNNERDSQGLDLCSQCGSGLLKNIQDYLRVNVLANKELNND